MHAFLPTTRELLPFLLLYCGAMTNGKGTGANKGLTAKQQAALAKCQPAQKAALRATYLRQNQSTNPAPRKQRNQPAQGRGQGAGGALQPIPRNPACLKWGFNAFIKQHMPTDEMTAPYSVTNFIDFMEFPTSPSANYVCVFAPRMMYWGEQFTGPMTDLIGVVYNGASTMASPTVVHTMRSAVVDQPPNPTGQDAQPIYFSNRLRLHNMSVKVECLGTNTGLVPPGNIWIGAVPYLEVGQHSDTAVSASQDLFHQIAMDAINVGYLRSVSAATLQDKAIICHSAVAEHNAYRRWYDIAVPPLGGSQYSDGTAPLLTSLEPIVVVIPKVGTSSDNAVNYRLTVAQEWCSRTPHNTLLRATQRQHQPTPPSIFNQAIAHVQDIGRVIAERAGPAVVDAVASRAVSALGSA